MNEIILIKTGEIALKGLNRSTFEGALMKNIRIALRPLGKVQVRKAQSTIMVEPLEDGFDMDEGVLRVSRIFGIAAYSRAGVVEKDMAAIIAAIPDYLGDTLSAAKTFKVEAKRSDKKFPLKSPEICCDAGGSILEAFPHLRVDVHKPEVTVMVEIRDYAAYIHADQLPGAGGMPVGTGGKAVILISGGIDSPVAAYMMAKRGVELTAVHFASPPYTSERAQAKVQRLLEIVSRYSGTINFVTVPFTEIQEKIAQNCPDDLTTLIMRRYMMKLSQTLAKKYGCEALITGESIGQVASQTMQALAVTDNAVDMPVFRPLIGMDKEEIIAIARKIDTFETSILPFEDCCTVFTPKHPRTRPKLEAVISAEQLPDGDRMYAQAVENVSEMRVYTK